MQRRIKFPWTYVGGFFENALRLSARPLIRHSRASGNPVSNSFSGFVALFGPIHPGLTSRDLLGIRKLTKMKAPRSRPQTNKAPARSTKPHAARVTSLRPHIAQPPRGSQRLLWLGPGFLWMVSAAGSGELLFTPRIGALYGYSLLWALLAAVILKWFINREIGRFTVCTGATVLEGFKYLPGPANWALWLIDRNRDRKEFRSQNNRKSKTCPEQGRRIENPN